MAGGMSVAARRVLLALSTVLAVGLVGAAVAWACLPGATIDGFPRAGPAGTDVLVSGNGFPDRPVEIHWDGPYGPVLATTHGPSFSEVTVTVPRASAGDYYITAIAVDRSGVPQSFKFTVTVPRTPPQGQTGPQGGAGGSPGGGGGNTVNNINLNSNAGDNGGPLGGGGDRNGGRQEVAAGRLGGHGGPAGRAAAGYPGIDGTAARVARRGSLGDLLARALDGIGSPSERTAVGDLWSGFFGSDVRASRASGEDTLLGGGSSRPALAAGAGLLGLGLVALIAGFGTAALRHRRAPSG